MLTGKTKIRVRYADTDQMQFVYNGKYLEYFEVGRTEMLRDAGLPYRVVEEHGYQLPLLSTYVKYISPAKYDDLLLVESFVKEMPKLKIHIDYRIFRDNGKQLVAEGYTEHVFIKTESKKAARPPDFFVKALKHYYDDKNQVAEIKIEK